MSKLFEFAVIYTPKPTKDESDRGVKPKSELVVDVTRVLVDDERAASMLAARAIPEAYADKLEALEICVRPF